MIGRAGTYPFPGGPGISSPPARRGGGIAIRPDDLKRRLSDALDLPGEITLDLPRVVLVGRLQVEVENHRGLISYEPHEVVVGVAGGQLYVGGADLTIREVTGEAIRILGRVDALRFEG